MRDRDCAPPRNWGRHRHGPPQFVRRFGCIFAAMLVLAAIGASTVASLLFRVPNRAGPVLAFGAAVVAALIIGFTLAFRRVSRVFQAQDALRRQLMADVAHELRTPLSILQGRIEGLLDGVYPRDDARLGELLDETQHLSRLVEDLRTIANAEAGALDLRKEQVDPAEIIRDAASSFDAIDVHIGELPMMDLDPVRIREVLLNLLSNAVRQGGRVAIHADAQPRQLVIRVSDTGGGIAAEDLPHIFDRFTKGRDSRGSGLGLAIARNLVAAHGGDIRAESRVGEGTVITVTLPR